ncbi:hypothetical protein SLG_15810 [Sphingobium sp. SYK-6]|uniref:hypothetical protein n=1 Tax=Sphingobium sp. (strain NBRC 103272 / SYK-6) TaxID=627192 RepID=UPI0002276F54|nr:hypothetical protein [Sphingobium sp. SYK-6]BAK66256.1 hypothetical protein SLG_15810 [Sphingobium sp. SYK-6]
MPNQQLASEKKSAERLAFDHYLRTGRRLSPQAGRQGIEHKFNPYHDPSNGRFTFAPGGPRSLSHVIISDRRSLHRAGQHASGSMVAKNASVTSSPSRPGQTISPSEAVYRPNEVSTTIQPAQYRANPRARMGDNGGPPLNDPLTLERTFPGLATAPGGSLVALADNILDLTGPANRLTAGLAEGHVNMLIGQIRTIDPGYRVDSLAFPATLGGQTNLIRQLRLDRAVAFYSVKGETRPLQVETLRMMQERADSAYIEGQALFDAGRLQPRLSREEAIGNYVDRAVRRELRDLYNIRGIDYSKGQQIRVIGREYDTSGSDPTYRIPDVRVGNVAFDVTISRKTLATPQVRGFFNSDFKPDVVLIVRPTQLGPNSTYAISRPRK